MMVEDGLEAGEPFQAHHLLAVQPAIRLAKLDVTLGWN
jgi:hypothetical protein